MCEVALFWEGGHSKEAESEVEESTLHESKENTMSDVFEKYQKKNHLLIRTE